MTTVPKHALLVVSLGTLIALGPLADRASAAPKAPSIAAPSTTPSTLKNADVIAFAARVATLYGADPSRSFASQPLAHNADVTPAGWAGYQQALNASLTPKAVGLITRATGPARIEPRGINAQGRSTWQVVQPVAMTVQPPGASHLTVEGADLVLDLVQVADQSPQQALRIERLALRPA